MKRLFAVALACAALPAAAEELAPADAARHVLERANAFRASEGRDPLRADAALEGAAQRFAQYMARTGKYGHGADGRTSAERAVAQGYEYCIVAENIAWQYRSQGFGSAGALAQALVEGWKRSPEHRENLLDPAVRETGVGLARSEAGRWFAVQMFGLPESASLSFSVRNRAGARVAYRVGEREFSLAPRVTRTHRICRSAELAIEARGFSARVADGARYIVFADSVSERR